MTVYRSYHLMITAVYGHELSLSVSDNTSKYRYHSIGNLVVSFFK